MAYTHCKLVVNLWICILYFCAWLMFYCPPPTSAPQLDQLAYCDTHFKQSLAPPNAHVCVVVQCADSMEFPPWWYLHG